MSRLNLDLGRDSLLPVRAGAWMRAARRAGCFGGGRLFFAMGLGAEVATQVVDTAEMDLPKRVSINRGQ